MFMILMMLSAQDLAVRPTIQLTLHSTRCADVPTWGVDTLPNQEPERVYCSVSVCFSVILSYELGT